MTFDEWKDSYETNYGRMAKHEAEAASNAWLAALESRAQWKVIPAEDVDLGDCFVGRWMFGKFAAFQRSSPCIASGQLLDFQTHYRPLAPPSTPSTEEKGTR